MALIKSRKFIRRRQKPVITKTRTIKGATSYSTGPPRITATTKVLRERSIQGPAGPSSFVTPGAEVGSVTTTKARPGLRIRIQEPSRVEEYQVPGGVTTVRGTGVDVRGTAAGVVRGVGSTGVNILGSMLGAGIRRLKGIRHPDTLIDPNMRFLYLGSSRISPTGRRHEAFELHFGRNWRERMLR